MNPLTRAMSLKVAACLAVALVGLVGLVPTSAHAQSSSNKNTTTQPSGAAKPSGKLLTREELRACMKSEASLKDRANGIEADRKSSDEERASIMKHREELKAEAESLDRANIDAVAAYNEKIRVLDARIDAWNPKNAALADKTKAYQASRDEWRTDCASRRYNEDDEKAIRAGK